ncbi:uncharacterized protein LOC127879542 [Dreissena polymorpha]|uniref:Uncharacterized protein n=1 Tax=Dreissena polymorpha TaxID=45954 RepID=A0A9D4QN74_DREPO|nr:uncharacterized protein LOC127879542 [Dreissena polymorpha]KAH3837376.1 hypothetical protein DPMN_110763 [Dreissena polymorpha]
MTISGHKSESSIRSYARTSADQKEKMARTLAEAISGKAGQFDRDHTGNTHVPAEHNTAVPSSSVGDIDVGNIDFLELTASQENCLVSAIHTVQDIQTVPTVAPGTSTIQQQGEPKLPIGTFNHSDRRELVQQSSYRAPVYYFNSFSMTINHN